MDLETGRKEGRKETRRIQKFEDERNGKTGK
jgi:hypothetical protein